MPTLPVSRSFFNLNSFADPHILIPVNYIPLLENTKNANQIARSHKYCKLINILLITMIITTEDGWRKKGVAQKQDLFWSRVNSRLPGNNSAVRRWSTTHSLDTTALQCITVILDGPCYLRVIFIRRCCPMIAIKLYLCSVCKHTLYFTAVQDTWPQRNIQRGVSE